MARLDRWQSRGMNLEGELLDLGVDEDWDIAIDSLLDDEAIKQMPFTNGSQFLDTCSDDGNSNGKKRRRVGNEDDARKIKEATESMLKLLKLDPDSEEGKKQRRRLRNRMSAAMHRERKKEQIDSLEEKLREKDAEILRLRRNLDALTAENASLRRQLGVPFQEPPTKSPESAYSSGSTSADSDGESSVGSLRPRSFGSPVSAGVSLLSLMCILGFSFRGTPSLTQFDGREVLWQSESPLHTSPGRFLLAQDSVLNESLLSDKSVTLSPTPPTIALKDFVVRSPNPLEMNPIAPLYKYDEKILPLYPPASKSIKVEVTAPSSNHSHLRSRPKQPSSRDLVPINLYKESEVLRPSSQVLMNEGRALLDPLLLSSQLVPAFLERSGINDKAITTYRIASHDKSPYPLTIVPSNKENLLMMVLPLSAIRWGSSWKEGSESLLETILSMHGYDNDANKTTNGSDSLWVEIGCSVFKAELVRNATLYS